jgi:hypothetical protein
MRKHEPPPAVRFKITNQLHKAPVGLDRVDELVERVLRVDADSTLATTIADAKESGGGGRPVGS